MLLSLPTSAMTDSGKHGQRFGKNQNPEQGHSFIQHWTSLFDVLICELMISTKFVPKEPPGNPQQTYNMSYLILRTGHPQNLPLPGSHQFLKPLCFIDIMWKLTYSSSRIWCWGHIDCHKRIFDPWPRYPSPTHAPSKFHRWSYDRRPHNWSLPRRRPGNHSATWNQLNMHRRKPGCCILSKMDHILCNAHVTMSWNKIDTSEFHLFSISNYQTIDRK